MHASVEERDRAGSPWRWILAAALLVGLVRFVRLSEWSLWIDEALTWTDYHVGLEGGEIRNPLGYAIVAWTVRALGGVPDELSLRLAPAIAGWLCIPATYLAFAGTFGRRRAAGAAVLVAVCSWHVYWSQNARFYTFAQLTTLCGAGLAFGGWRTRSFARVALGLVVSGLAALFHPSAVLVPLGWVVAAVVTGWRAPLPEERWLARRLAILGVVALACASPWILATFETYRVQKAQGASLAAALSSVAHFARTTGFYVTPLLCVAALAGAWIGLRRRDRALVVAASTVAIGLAAAAAAALLVRVSAQYVFVLLPWIALLAAAPFGADEEERERGSLAGAWLALLVLASASNVGLYLTVRQGERPQWRAAYDFVASQRGERDLVLGMETPVGEHYFAPRSTDLRNTRHVAWLDYFRAREPRAWAEHGRRTWYVINPELLHDWDPADADVFRRMLANECRLVRCYPLYVESRDLSVWVYVRG